MAYYLRNERDEDVLGAYRRYQEYLRAHEREFPPSAFALGTAEWYQNPMDHCCPHDAWLESVTISEPSTGSRYEERSTAVRMRLFGAYHDGFIQLFYPRVFSYSLESGRCVAGLGNWRYDEFRLSASGHLVHEIEWAGFPREQGSRWLIEASDVEYEWTPT